MIKYKQLGNGGAFDYTQCNSSFIVESNNEYLLFDCGYSVFAELRKQDADINIPLDLKQLTCVYISHMDDDHIGSLKSLIYYQYFINNIVMEVIANPQVLEYLRQYLSDINSVMEKGIKVIKELCIFAPSITWNNLSLGYTETNHGKPCFGLCIESKDSALFITGDTKATPKIRNIIDNLYNIHPNVKVFHDYSNWNCESSQVHACLSNVNSEYSELTKKRYTHYHNGESFNPLWQTI